MNDLDANSGDSEVTKFEDDTTLNAGIIKFFSTQEDIESVLSWLVRNKLTMIADKCELVLLGSGKLQVFLKKKFPRKYKKSCIFPGVYLNEWQRFNQHIE